MPGRSHSLDDLRRALALLGPSPAGNIARQLGISQPTFSRLARLHRASLIVAGKGRATLYAARREIAGVGGQIPLYAIDEDGRARDLALLFPVEERGFYVEARSEEMTSTFYDDLPYFLHDLRPQGFLGRLLPAGHLDLHLPADVRRWSGDHVLRYLTRAGWSSIGELIVGEDAFQEHLRQATSPAEIIEREDRTKLYPEFARGILQAGVPGSSAGGEQPKFLARRRGPNPDVLVKFSPPCTDAVGRRWGDLLVAEHLAHEVLRRSGHPAAISEVVLAEDRVFLEVERFDRVGPRGRRGLTSLLALDGAYAGVSGGWAKSAQAVADSASDPVVAAAVEEIAWRELFGTLIENSDMHLGNLSFFTRGTRVLGLAPTYDMLPMRYAPREGNIVPVELALPTPRASDAPRWATACREACALWSAVAGDARISDEFRKIADENGSRVAAATELAELLPSAR